MYLTDEQKRYDDTRWHSCNLETELKYGGVAIKDRKSITNEDIRFYAWICRAALKRIKSKHRGKWFGSVCSKCGVSVSGWYDYLYCPFCGSRNEWDEEEIKNKKIKSSGKKLAKAISENAQKLCDKYNELREEDNKELFEKVEMLKEQVRKKRKEHKKIIYPKPIEKCSNFINCSVKMDESEDKEMKYEIHPDGTMTLNPAYTEILRLDKMLTEKGIEHTSQRLYDGYLIGVNYDGREIGDAVEHYFSYGNKENLLETMGFDENDVTGHRTAEDVMTVVEAAIERKRGQKQ